MSPFDDVRGAHASLTIFGVGSCQVLFDKKPVSFEQLIDKMQAQFGEPKSIGGPKLPKEEKR